MKINLSPVRKNENLTASVSGDVITLNGVAFDFSPLQEGASLPAMAISTPWILGDVSRISGVVNITLCLPHGANAPEETRFPAAYDVPMTVVDGPVPLPPYDAPPVVDDVQLPEIETEQEVTP